MTENSQEQEKDKLSFKEQILRDLAHAKDDEAELSAEAEERPHVEEASPAQISEEVEESLRAEKVTSDSIPNVSPVESPLPSLEEMEHSLAEAEADEKEFNTHKTKVPVSYPSDKEAEGASEEAVQPTVYGKKNTTDADKLSRVSRSHQLNKRKRQNRVAGKIVKTVLALVFVGLVVTGFFAYNFWTSSLQAVNAKDTQYYTVEIPAGSSTKEIGVVLEKAGLIKNAQVFNFYAKIKNYGNFQSGYYNLQKSMNLDTISKLLQQGGTETPQDPTAVKLVIPEGYTLDQIAATVASTTKDSKNKISAEDFLQKAQDENFINQAIAKYPTLMATLPSKESGVRYRLEGYLFPATYEVKSDTNAENLIDQMLAAMDQTLTPYYETLTAKNLTVNDVLTLASLVEKEGSADKDRQDIASVFYNRLNQNMPLQSNIAILYAEGKLGQKTTLAEDASINTAIDSPFNVYQNIGLMPGPVDSPSLAAIEATVNPTKTDYLYFVANTDTGEVFFANTYEEHAKNVEEHVNSKLTQSSSSN